MLEIHIRLKVRDFDAFWQGFRERGVPLRERHGGRGARVLRSQDDPQVVHLLLQWDSREAFAAFLQDPEVQDAMVKHGVTAPPEIEHLEVVGELPS
jgi:heme-degrading monooxygenase HmoA